MQRSLSQPSPVRPSCIGRLQALRAGPATHPPSTAVLTAAATSAVPHGTSHARTRHTTPDTNLAVRREVNASAELSVEVLDVGGSQASAKGKSAKALEQMGGRDPSKVTEASRFMGSLEVPLATTLHFRRGACPPYCILGGAQQGRVGSSDAFTAHRLQARAHVHILRSQGALMSRASTACFQHLSCVQAPSTCTPSGAGAPRTR